MARTGDGAQLGLEHRSGSDRPRGRTSGATHPPVKAPECPCGGSQCGNWSDPAGKADDVGGHCCGRPSREEPKDGKAYSFDHVGILPNRGAAICDLLVLGGMRRMDCLGHSP